jgi:acyl phosphate:glycerol-3-phosphate acyltransferase
MLTLTIVSLIVAAYLLGSIPTAVWLGKTFYGIDVRQYGSKNAGATNTFRTLGKKAGIPVMLIDITKGFLATNLVYFAKIYNVGTIDYVNFQLLLGLIAVVGHVFPVFANFKGGKGIATLLGMLLAIHTEAAVICMLIFIIVLLISKYVSLSSMITGFTFPLIMIFYFHEHVITLLIFGILVSILILITHQKNIERLIAGSESRANLFKRNHK